MGSMGGLRYKDKVTVITGGSKGIGEGCVRVFGRYLSQDHVGSISMCAITFYAFGHWMKLCIFFFNKGTLTY